MTRKQKRLAVIGGALAFLGAATALTFYALGQKASYFFMPAELQAASLSPGQRIRLGGLVEPGSIRRGQGTQVSFAVTDGDASVPVTYTGILPDLFREGQGVITEGTFGTDGAFIADSVLAKHDETYMPKEVADSLKEKGVWQEEEAPAAAPGS
jgi:cytochrome c-type biogenesis protein CcmE